MIRGVDPQSARFLTDYARLSRRLEKAQARVSTGLRVGSAADDPDRLANLLAARSQLEFVAQTRGNLERIGTETATAEKALQQAVRVLDRALVLGTQGANGVVDAATRASLAGEVEGVLQQLAAISQSTVDGRYIFSGDADQTAPYNLNLTQDDPFSAYLGSVASRQALHPSGSQFPVSRTAQQIFDNPDPAKNVFHAVNALRLALRNDDQEAVTAAVGQVRQASTHLNSELSFYGSVQSQLQETINFSHKMELQLKSQISSVENTDMAEALVEMNQANFHRDAAMKSFANIPKRSLFDLLG